MLGLKLNHVSKRGPRWYVWINLLYMKQKTWREGPTYFHTANVNGADDLTTDEAQASATIFSCLIEYE